MFDAVTPVAAQEIESQAVLGRIKFVQQPDSQARPLLRIDNALENRMLHSLSIT
jgi:hypothetical protein